MTGQQATGPRLPLGAGQHVVLFGATGAGKTTTARRLIAARTLAQHAALFVLDQKGDAEDVQELRRLAAAAGVPFILFDSQDPHTDRWQPLWGTPDSVAARAVEPIKQSEPYYYDVLRRHLDIVCKVLRAADRWPPSVPLLADACQPVRYPAIVAIADRLGDRARPACTPRERPRSICHIAERHRRSLRRRVPARGRARAREPPARHPRISSDGDTVAVRLIEALRQRAVVMWRTHADTMPDEAAALSVLALADLHDAAEHAGASWTLLLDEFGAVIKMAAARGVAILQRGRSHGGQVIVITQSAADIEALTGQPGLLASLTDNFTGVVAHRQTSPESRDWLAKLMGTRAIWQTTNQTAGHGSQHSGRGSARRVREFRIGADVFSTLDRGEAVIYTPLAGDPTRTRILHVQLADRQPARIDESGSRHSCETLVHPEASLSDPGPRTASAPPTSSSTMPPASELDPDSL